MLSQSLAFQAATLTLVTIGGLCASCSDRRELVVKEKDVSRIGASAQANPFALRADRFLPGQSNASNAPRFEFCAAGSRSDASRIPSADEVRNGFYFVNEFGDITQTDVGVYSPELQVGFDVNSTPAYCVAIGPSAKLQPDSRYWIVAGQDGTVSIDGASFWTGHFSTGSAPRLVGAVLSRKNSFLQLIFSEPLDMGTVSGDHLVRHGDSFLNTCIQFNRECVANSPAQTSDSFAVAYSADVLPDPGELSFSLDGKTRGVAKSVEEVTNTPDAQIVSPNQWKSCHNGGAWCWTEYIPAPTK